MNKLIGVGVRAGIVVAMTLGSGVQAANLEGTWVLQDADNTQAKLDAAVEDVVKEINFFIRALARPVLEKETQICNTWLLATDATQFLWQCDESPPGELALSANKSEMMSDDGRLIHGTLQQSEDRVATILESDRGKRTNVWQIVSDNEMRYTTTLESDKIPKPLTWTLTYHKQ
ncbi:hypothetical protein HGG82_06335 [Marinomonas sp. M1K-6]|uniref:Uncharacterized protein n=1 Tax=Marinomonas profundi TaxID=2726122 RepID=A0A847R0Y8_9GAMM|nr:hypothetical protein [Marinomonas profundi]NLQ17242.1 hypothetical protein [Marinomonas profundi]UDV04568.1 hypothetical protein J8N69_07435 [Marinomonas profundi]